jgi:hypothetical protein
MKNMLLVTKWMNIQSSNMLGLCKQATIGLRYLMHLVGYLYEDYDDARSLEHKVIKLCLRV